VKAISVIALGTAVLFALGGCTGVGAGMTPSASVTTTMQGWEHYFRLDWAPQATPNGVLIDGYVYNTYGQSMANVRVLGQALDRDNNVIGQRIDWVPGIVPNFSRSYFRIASLPPADHYRVSVWAFDIIDSDDFMHRW
jgi:hypothetical protein